MNMKNKLSDEVLNAKPEELTEDKLEKVDGGFDLPELDLPGDYSGEWKWKDKNTDVGEPVPAGDYNVIFTPKENKNYDWSEPEV